MKALHESATEVQQASQPAARESSRGSAVTVTSTPSSPSPRQPAPTVNREVISPPLLPFERDSYAATALGDVVDRSLNAAASHFTAGLSLPALAEAWFDWAVHLAAAPGKRIQLVEKALKKSMRLALYSQAQALPGGCPRCIEPLSQDRRFNGEAWQRWPYNLIYQGFLLQQQWGTRARAPERRLVTIEDVGAMAAGLVSDFARNVTGSICYVDAGYHVMS